ncbi:hypothetical protein G9F32_05320 [Acinetobacter sp. 194]|uniref:hypothetical protein n=1 Tax=Acinetobacter shaoyimingii TaxID=2715164 RepID=UPI00140D40E4|nr:hypothetical protein [Acinetobacter shaoyimingii]NHB57457.1 hypothetical protein [Acinetobacter shaoyimingii]
MSNVKTGVCLNCQKITELQKSHAINKTFFREISTKCPETFGKPLQIKYHDNEANLDGNQITYFQFCKNCENYFNSRYEDYSVKFFKNNLSRVKQRTTKKFIRYSNVDQKKLGKFLLSIYWKISNSENDLVRNVSIFPNNINAVIRNILNNDECLSKIGCKIRVFKLIDSKFDIKDDGLKQIIMTPFLSANGTWYSMMFYGFFIQMTFYNFREDDISQFRFLKDNIGSLYVNFKEINEIHEFKERVLSSYY